MDEDGLWPKADKEPNDLDRFRHESTLEHAQIVAEMAAFAAALAAVAREGIRQHGETKREELRQNGETTRTALRGKQSEVKAIDETTEQAND